MTNQFIIKNFHKNKAVIAIIHYPNHRVREVWALPHPSDKNIIHIGDGEYSIDTTTDYFSLKNGVPCFTYQYKEKKPINVLKDIQEQYTAQEFKQITNNTFIRQVHKAQSGVSDINWAMLTLLVCIAGFALLYYVITKGA